jgi:hypothetical protein
MKQPAKKAAVKKTVAPSNPVSVEVGIGEMAEFLGVHKSRVDQLFNEGVVIKSKRNCYDLIQSAKNYIRRLQKDRQQEREAFDTPKDDGGTVDPQELQDLIAQIKAAKTYNDARTLKTQIDALRSGFMLEVDQGKYAPIATVREAYIRIGAAIKGATLRMESDLPPMLEGLSPAAMQKLIREKVDEVLQVLSEQGSDVWNNEQ